MTATAQPPVAHRPDPVGTGATRPQHPKLAAAAACAVGVLATPVGAGLGIRHLTKAGLTGTTVLGVVLLGIGLTLLGSAGVIAWRNLHRWQRLGLLPIGLLMVLVIWPVTEGTMLAVAPRNGLSSVSPADPASPTATSRSKPATVFSCPPGTSRRATRQQWSPSRVPAQTAQRP